MGSYSMIEQLKPRWRERYRVKLLKLGRISRGIIIPAPVIKALGAEKKRYVSVGWCVTQDDKDILLLDVE